MKKAIYFIWIISLLYACNNDEEKTFEYKVSIRNTSTHLLTIDAYREGIIRQHLEINTSENGLSCNYYNDFFIGYQLAGCLIDSVKFTFDNGKGYLTSINYPTEYELSNHDGIFGSGPGFEKIEGYTYEFIITQEDFNNAHDLPK